MEMELEAGIRNGMGTDCTKFGTPVISCIKQIVMILGLFKGLMKQT